jgi:tRNA pseudouridine38-40 synthase
MWHVYQRLDVEAMREAAAPLVGTHDFASYETSGSPRLTTVRTVLDLVVERRQAELTDRIIIEVEANGFLYNMVRNIVGTLVQVGKGRGAVHWPAQILALRDRTKAGMTAPAQGLFLVGVEYVGDDSECRIQNAELAGDEEPLE